MQEGPPLHTPLLLYLRAMATTLCLDFGNTRLKGAFFTNDQLTEIVVLTGDPYTHLQSLLAAHRPERSILSSVVDHDPRIDTLLAENTAFHRLSSRSVLPITIPVGKPDSVGADRLALAAAATFLFPGRNNLAIGLGTCITYNFINQDHQLIGGSISPGMEMRFRAMHEYTALLPLAKGAWNVPLVGYDTITNLQSGVVFGMAKEIDGIIEAYAEKWGNFNVLLTGGDIRLFESHLKNKIFADPDLIFKGLYAISQLNNG
jgi:type III pantothenate kinase